MQAAAGNEKEACGLLSGEAIREVTGGLAVLAGVRTCDDLVRYFSGQLDETEKDRFKQIEIPKEKAGCWTRRGAFAQVRQGPNIQLLPYPLVRNVAIEGNRAEVKDADINVPGLAQDVLEDSNPDPIVLEKRDGKWVIVDLG